MTTPVFIRNLPDGAIAVSAGGLFGERRASRPLPASLSARRERVLLELTRLGKSQFNNQPTNQPKQKL
jgi:hypothetical protein